MISLDRNDTANWPNSPLPAASSQVDVGHRPGPRPSRYVNYRVLKGAVSHSIANTCLTDIQRQHRMHALEWCKRDAEERAKLKPLYPPLDPGKIPSEGYWRVPTSLREWLQILGVKDIDAAEKMVRKTGPFNQWKETAWDLWRRGEI